MVAARAHAAASNIPGDSGVVRFYTLQVTRTTGLLRHESILRAWRSSVDGDTGALAQMINLVRNTILKETGDITETPAAKDNQVEIVVAGVLQYLF